MVHSVPQNQQSRANVTTMAQNLRGKSRTTLAENSKRKITPNPASTLSPISHCTKGAPIQCKLPPSHTHVATGAHCALQPPPDDLLPRTTVSNKCPHSSSNTIHHTNDHNASATVHSSSVRRLLSQPPRRTQTSPAPACHHIASARGHCPQDPHPRKPLPSRARPKKNARWSALLPSLRESRGNTRAPAQPLVGADSLEGLRADAAPHQKAAPLSPA